MRVFYGLGIVFDIGDMNIYYFYKCFNVCFMWGIVLDFKGIVEDKILFVFLRWFEFREGGFKFCVMDFVGSLWSLWEFF